MSFKNFESQSEAKILIALFFISLIVATTKIYSWSTAPHFYQTFFSPAIMVACDRAYTDLVPLGNSLPAKFLNNQVDSLSCSDLPQNLSISDGISGGQQWFYLMQFTGNLWKITGINWKVMDCAVAVFFALTILITFKLLLLVSSKRIAVILSLIFALYSTHLDFLSSLRDYSKVPFILSIILIMAITLVNKVKWSSAAYLAFAAGSLLAIGYGFRADVGLLLPICLMFYVLRLKSESCQDFAKRGLALLAFVVGFVAFMSPLYEIFREKGTCSYHFGLLGLADIFYAKLGLVRPEAYSILHEYNDRSAAFLVASYADRILNFKGIIFICGSLYDQISRDLFIKFIEYFPLDFYRKAIKSPFVIFGMFIVPLLIYIPIVWSKSKRLCVAFYLVVLYLCFTSIIQFDLRHNFYLAVFALVSIAGILDWLSKNRWSFFRPYISALVEKRFAGSLLTILCFCGIADYALFKYQTIRLTAYGERLGSLATEDLTISTMSETQPTVDLILDVSKLRADWVHSELYKLTLDVSSCVGSNVKIQVEYAFNGVSPNYDLSRDINLKIYPQEISRALFFPVYYQASGNLDTWSYPSKISIVDQPRSCLAGLQVVTDRGEEAMWVDFSVSHPTNSSQLKALYY